jgi:glycosyltransferase involved in cell wall biosynthesis
MLVSIVMAARNAEEFIGEAIESALGQTYPEWELIVVDDGSTDATADRAEAFGDERVRVLRGPHVGVLTRLRNTGIEHARGEAIALLDADDLWLPEKLERQVAVLRDRPGAGVVHTAAAALVDGERRELPRAPSGPPFASMLETNFVYSSSVLVRRGLFSALGAFDPDPALHYAPDLDLWLRFAPRTEFVHLDEVLLLYRVHGEQMSARSREMGIAGLEALARAADRDPELVRLHRASYLLGRGRQHDFAGQRLAALGCFAAAVALRPDRGRGWLWLARGLARFLPRVPWRR